MDDEKRFTQMYIDKDTHREIQIAATLKSDTMKNIVLESFELWKIKHRLSDRIAEFKRQH